MLAGVLLISLTVGIAAGMIGGIIETVVLRLLDVLLAIPVLVLALAVIGVLGVGFGNLLIALNSLLATLTARGARRESATTRLAAVGLAEIDPAARPDELSVGQCQRVAIARALAAEPALIVADEPTSALDVASAAIILRLLAAAANNGAALVIVSHDRTLLDVLAHRVLEMRDGVLAG